MNLHTDVPMDVKRVRIWLVDDSESLRCLLAEFLGGETDFECARQFASAEAMLAALERETPPDVILLDVNMGGMSGLDAIRPIKAIASSTRVLILTALSNWDSKTQALRDGASDFLLKSCPLTIPDHIRLAVARPLEKCIEADPAESIGANSLLLNRRALESNGRSPEGTPRPHSEGRRKGPWQGRPGRLLRGVQYLWALFGWGGRVESRELAEVAVPPVSESPTAN